MRGKAISKPSQTASGFASTDVQTNATLLVRPIRRSDFTFIRELSKRIEGYTVPPPYVLWMLRRFQGELCLIVEGPTHKPLGYMLATSGGIRSSEMFIWQLAATFEGRRLRVSVKLASHVRKLVKKHSIQRITFTAVPDSGATRSIASLANQVFGRTLTAGSRLPKSVAASEREFYFLP
jgi:hypothetical protein